MPVITSIEDLKRMHRARAPRMFYDYAESGSYTEQTFRENTTDFARLKLRQKVAVDMSNRSTASDVVGLPAAMPVALAPVGTSATDLQSGPEHPSAPPAGETRAGRGPCDPRSGTPRPAARIGFALLEQRMEEHKCKKFLARL